MLFWEIIPITNRDHNFCEIMTCKQAHWTLLFWKSRAIISNIQLDISAFY